MRGFPRRLAPRSDIYKFFCLCWGFACHSNGRVSFFFLLSQPTLQVCFQSWAHQLHPHPPSLHSTPPPTRKWHVVKKEWITPSMTDRTTSWHLGSAVLHSLSMRCWSEVMCPYNHGSIPQRKVSQKVRDVYCLLWRSDCGVIYMWLVRAIILPSTW